MPFVIDRIPSEEFGIAVHSVGILTRTGTHLKLIRSCHCATIATGRSLTTSTLKLLGVTFFFSPFGRTPPLLPLVRDPRPATPLVSTALHRPNEVGYQRMVLR